MTTDLTAVIPSHNRPLELGRAIESVEGQTSAAAIVVVDDGSTPPVDRSSLPAGTVVVRHDTARGPAIARNAGVAAARTEWIGFLDDDDIWLPDKVRAVLEVAELVGDDVGVIFHGTSRRPAQTSRGYREIDDPLKRVLRRQPPHLSGTVVRRTVHEEAKFDETMWAGQDVEYLVRLAQATRWIEIRRDLSQHGDQPAEGSAIAIDSRVEGRLRVMEKHGDLIRNDPVAHSFFYARLGHQYRRAHRYSEARQSFTTALRIRPLSSTAWKGLIRTGLDRSLRG